MGMGSGMSAPEKRLVDAARTGALVDLCTGVSDVDAVANAPSWSANRVVRAEVLARLLKGDTRLHNGRPRAVKLRGALVTGELDLEAVSLVCPLLLQDCHVDEVINLRDAQAPTLRLHGCCVPGIDADQLETRGNLEFCDRFIAHGCINLSGAHVGGSLVLNGAELGRSGGRALKADRITIDGTLFCMNGFVAHGEFRLVSAHIKSALDFSTATLMNLDGPALNTARMRVDDAVFFRDGFSAHGEVRIRNSRIASFVDFADATLSNPSGLALHASGLTVERGVHFQTGFTASGGVTFAGAHIGRLHIAGGNFRNPTGTAVDLKGMRASSVSLLPDKSPDGVVDLSGAQVTSFRDNPETWPSKLFLQDFTYEVLHNDSASVRSRLKWLSLHAAGYMPGIYDQLAATYQRAGGVEASRIVSIAKQKRRRQQLNPAGKVWNWLLYLTVGYGYRTWWAALWLLGLLTVGSVVFAGAYPDNMTPTAAVVPTFQPVAYTMDVLVPLIDLGQKKTWLPRGAAMIWSWILTGAGWLLTTAVVAGLTNALKRD